MSDGFITYSGRRLADLGEPRPGSADAARMIDLDAAIGRVGGADTVAPNPPTSLTTDASIVEIGNAYYADVAVGWAAPTTNVDGSVLDDLSHYEIQHSRGASPTEWQASGTVPAGTTATVINSLFPGEPYSVRVRAVDKTGNPSFWLATTATPSPDSTPPPVPSDPVVTPYLGQLRIYWDGLGASAEVMPGDFRHLEVHASSTSAVFTPTAATLIDTMLAAGYSVLTDLPYDSTTFIRLLAVDTSGNRSAATIGVAGTTERVTGLDIEALTIATENMADAAINSAKIADASIISAKIANLAVDDAKIGNVSVGKLTAGSLNADVTVAARIKTANTGARVELNSTGLQAYNSANAQTVSIAAASGDATILGRFKTGTPGGGTAYITMDDASDRSTIAFWNSAGTSKSYINSPPSAGGAHGLGVNTGTFNISGTTPGFTRLYMTGGSTTVLGTARGSDESAFGGELYMNSDFASLRRAPLGGAHTGGEVYVDADQVIMSRNVSGAATGGRFYVTGANAVLEYASGGSGQRGIWTASDGVHSYGSFVSDANFSWTPNGAFTTAEFRLDRWGPFVAVHIYVTADSAVASGSSTQIVGTITSSGNLPLSETAMSCEFVNGAGTNSGAAAGYINSAGTVRLRWLSRALAAGDLLRMDAVYFRS